MVALIVEKAEAATLARDLADRKGIPVDEAVIASLRASLASALPTFSVPPRAEAVPSYDQLTADQRSEFDALRALVRDAQASILPGATSDHSDMYDENGLPI